MVTSTGPRIGDTFWSVCRIKYRLGDLPLWLPAAAFGETGAATGILAICLGMKSFQRRYAPECDSCMAIFRQRLERSNMS